MQSYLAEKHEFANRNRTRKSYEVSDLDQNTAHAVEETKIYDELISELKKLDLSSNEARILVYLLSHGSSTASDITRFTGIQRTDTYHYLSQLLSKGIVVTTFTKPQKYSALSFEEAIDCLVQSKYNLLTNVLKSKRECQDKLERISRFTNEIEKLESNQYQVLGSESVLSRLKTAIAGANTTISAFVSQRVLAMLHHAEITDELVAVTQKNVRVSLRTVETSTKMDFSKDWYESLGLTTITDPIPLNFMIVDDGEMVIIMENKQREISGFYTNNPAMIATFKYLYERLS
jgi:sugar-specific transcriptional regulator TrmB